MSSAGFVSTAVICVKLTHHMFQIFTKPVSIICAMVVPVKVCPTFSEICLRLTGSKASFFQTQFCCQPIKGLKSHHMQEHQYPNTTLHQRSSGSYQYALSGSHGSCLPVIDEKLGTTGKARLLKEARGLRSLAGIGVLVHPGPGP